MSNPRQPAPPDTIQISHSADEGPWRGNAFNVLPNKLAPNHPSGLIGAVTDFNGTVLRPMPGMVPFAHSFSLSHPGSDDGASTEFNVDGLTLWLLTEGPGSERVLALVNNNDTMPASRERHPFPGEVMLTRGVTIQGIDRIYENHTPLVERNSSYEMQGPSFLPATAATMDEFQPSEFTPNMVVIAADGNPVKALVRTDEAPGMKLRKFGLNPPQGDPSGYASTSDPFGEQLELKRDGESNFTLDPDHDFAIDLTSAFTLTANINAQPVNGPFANASRIALCIPTGSSPSVTVTVTGDSIDLATGEITEDDTEALVIDGLSTSSNGTKYLYSSWTDYYVTTKYWVSKGTSSDVVFSSAGGGTGTANKILAFRVGRPLGDGRPTEETIEANSWRHAYAWGRVDGDYVIRGGHTDFPETRPEQEAARWGDSIFVDDESNYRISGFVYPLRDDAPNRFYFLLRKFPTVNSVDLPENAAGQQIYSAYYKVREVPIRQDPGTGNWLTDSGYPDHDVQLENMVIDNPYTEYEIIANNDSWPGAVIAQGGCYGCARWNQSMWFWGKPRFLISNVSATAGSAQWTSTTDDFHDWFIGRRMIYQGKPYNIRRVFVEAASSTAYMETVEAFDGTTSNGPAHLEEELATFFWTVPGSDFAENTPALWQKSLPVRDEIQSFQAERNYAIAYGKRFVFLITQDFSGLNVYQEQVEIPVTNIEIVGTNNAAAGLNSTTRVDGALASYTGRGVSIGFSPDDLQDITSADNSSLWRELIDQGAAKYTQLAYDEVQGHLIAGNVKTTIRTYGEESDYGLIMDMRNAGALTLAWPWPVRAVGVADLNRSKVRLTGVRDGAIVMVATVSTLGTGGAATSTGDWLVVYDSIDDSFSAIAASAFGADGIADEQRGGFQGYDGKIRMLIGTSDKVRVELVYNDTESAWQLNDYSAAVATYPAMVAQCAAWDGTGYYTLGEDLDGNGYGALYHFSDGDVEFAYAERVGGRYKVFTDSNFSSSNIKSTILTGPSGEIFLFGSSNTLIRVDPHSLEIIGEEETITGPVAPKQYGINRHREIFITDVDGSDVQVWRYRLATNGFSAAATRCQFEGANNYTGPDTKIGLLVDQRQQAHAVVSATVGSDLGFKVYTWAEADNSVDVVTVSRSGYDRTCLSVVQAGQFAWYLVKDEPAAGADEYRLVKAVGEATLPQDNTIYAGDGKMDTDEANGHYKDLVTAIAGSGGALSYVSIDGTVQGAKAQPDQCNATLLQATRGLGMVEIV